MSQLHSDLLLTRDKNNKFVGGGYTLNSSFLNSGIPAFTHMSGGSKSRSRSRSRSRDSENENAPTKVSEIFERANGRNALVIPAGIFMIHGNATTTTTTEKPETDDAAGIPMKTRLKGLLYETDDGDAHNRIPASNDDVIPNDLYEKLLALVSPSHTNRYWDPKSTTRKRREPVTKSKTRNNRQRK